MPTARVDLLARSTLNFALLQAGVPIVQLARVTNTGDDRLDGASLVLRLHPDIGPPVTLPVETLHPGEFVTLDVVDLRIPPNRLRSILEAERAEIAWELHHGPDILTSGAVPIELLAWNEWPGESAPPALLAVFTTPNHPAIAGVLKQVSDHLGRTTGDPAISGYQSRSVDRVRAQLAALYDTIQSFEIAYVGVPASFETHGQKVRLPDVVLHDRLANCLDTSLLFASCLEQMGLHPLIVTVPGHAFPGVWLVDDRFPEVVVHDAARLRTAIGLDQLVFFDSSISIARPAVPFEAARIVAHRALADDELQWALDIQSARPEGWRPIPVRGTVEPDLPTELPDHTSQVPETPLPVRPSAPIPTSTDPVAARFSRWKERLLDLSLRNKLLAFRTDVLTSIPLDVPDISRFEDRLASETPLELRARPPKDDRDERDAALVEVRADPADLRARRLADLAKGIVQTTLSEADLMLHAIALERGAKTDLEEGGANTLFCAVGFLRWFEATQGGMPKLAPLLLVPVTLEVNRTARKVGVRRLPEDPVANFTLIEKLRRDFGLDLSAIGNLESDDSGVDVGALLRTARTAISRMDRWEVREDVALGQFVFGKFLLWKDLAENTAALLANPVVRQIANRSGTTFVNRTERTRPEDLDRRIPAADLALPIDADSTQMAAVHSALNGRSFVLQGPPGTGKSQTITNLIAASLAANKTVLFVAEKRAALEVVHRRLQQSGLADFCLELHSNKANKKEVLGSLMQALERTDRSAEPPWASHSQKLEQSRNDLNQYPDALHRVRTIGRSFYQVSGEVLALKGVERVPLSKSLARSLTAEQFDQRKDVATRFATAAANVEPVAVHPWRTCEVVGWSAALENDVGEQLSIVLDLHRSLEGAVSALATHLGVSPPVEPERLLDLITLGARISDGPAPNVQRDALGWATWVTEATTHADAVDAQHARRSELATRWTDGVYQLDLVPTEALFRTWSTRFFLFAWFMLFSARRQLRPLLRASLDSGRIHTDLQLALAAREREDALERTTRTLVGQLGGVWDGADGDGLRRLVERGERLRKAAQRAGTAPDVLRLVDPEATTGLRERAGQLAAAADQRWTACLEAWTRLTERLATPAPPDDEPFGTRERRAGDWANGLSKLRYWGLYLERAEEMRAVGLGPVADAHRQGRIAAEQVEKVTRHSLLAPWVDAIRDEEPVLRTFEGTEHHRRVERFRLLDQQHQRLAGQVVVHRLEQRLPNGTAQAAEASEPGILIRESKKKTRQKPIRKLLLEIPNLLPKLKPCLLMSPLSVAQYLPASGRKFDLVVFDEASQIGTHDAIGALARGSQVVVVGDSRQLPPTTFFQRAGDDAADENDFEELESILDEAVASGLPEEQLGWHYRSRHEALIQFSNTHFYGNRLNVFPAARGKVEDLGVSWHFVQGVYDKGTSRTNRKEAEALVTSLVTSLLATRPGVRTFGVVTFSQAQQTLVSDLIDEQRRAHPELEGHFGGIDEPVFVKNLENVQGDERDEILFSIAYGPDESGKVAMNFGPLNREGGERRLNVAVTRARQKLRVFSSLTADQIDLNRTKATGPRHLQEFLRYAQASGTRPPEGTNTKGEFDSDFERQVFDALASSGYEVHCQVGCRGYKIDLAVVHPEKPGEYVLAIEADGAAYHSGATARDRDRLRQQVLEGLGWKVHRIWSTDWWYERQREIDRLMKAVSDAIRSAGVVPVPVIVPAIKSEPAPVRLQQAIVAKAADVYQVARPAPVSTDPETLYDRRFEGELRRVIAEVVRVEAPLHVDALARRVAAAFGAMKATTRLRTRVLQVAVLGPPGIEVRGEFVWLPGVEPSRWVRVRSAAGEPRDADEIPPEELAAAAAQVLADSLSLPEDVLIRETARRVGIQRVGKKVGEVVAAAVELLVRRGGARREGANIVQVAA